MRSKSSKRIPSLMALFCLKHPLSFSYKRMLSYLLTSKGACIYANFTNTFNAQKRQNFFLPFLRLIKAFKKQKSFAIIIIIVYTASLKRECA